MSKRTNTRAPLLMRSSRSHPHLNILLLNRVNRVTFDRYLTAYQHFLDYCRANLRRPRPTAESMDSSLSEYVLHTYRLHPDRSPHRGNLTLNAVLYFHPQYRSHLPLSAATLTGWERIYNSPARRRPPFTWDMVCLIGLQFARSGEFEAGIATFLAFDGYFRINELLHLTVADVIFPGRTGHQSQSSILFRLSEAKGGMNQEIVLDRVAFTPLVRWLVQGKQLTDFLFPFRAPRYRTLLKSVLQSLRLDKVGFTPHSLRHGGASHDYALRRPIEEIVIRGRWASIRSARRYLQSARALLLQHLLDDLPPLSSYDPSYVTGLFIHYMQSVTDSPQ